MHIALLNDGSRLWCWLQGLALVIAATIAAPAIAQPLRLAVVELRNEAKLSDGEIAYLTDQVRSQATTTLPSERFLVMTRESIQALLPPGKTLADCSKGQCEVEVGRLIGADYIVTGEVLIFDGEFKLNLKAHHCTSGGFLGSSDASGAKLRDLLPGLKSASETIYRRIAKHAGVGQSVATPNTASDGQYGAAPEAWSPSVGKKTLVKFTSDPPGAVVLVDGSIVCQSTPCSRLVAAGEVQVQMQRERYAPRSELVTVSAEGPAAKVDWTLEPQFGWLTVHTVPESLAVTINGEPAVRAPVVRREVDPGPYHVRLSEGRYYEKGERATVATGTERVVTLVPIPREGAIEVTATDAQGNDVAGKVSVDGKPVGEAPGTYKLMVGKHRVLVTGSAGGWKGDVTVAERQVAPVTARLDPSVSLRPVGLSDDSKRTEATAWLKAAADSAGGSSAWGSIRAFTFNFEGKLMLKGNLRDFSMELTQTRDGRYLSVTRLSSVDALTQGFDGSSGWAAYNGRVQDDPELAMEARASLPTQYVTLFSMPDSADLAMLDTKRVIEGVEYRAASVLRSARRDHVLLFSVDGRVAGEAYQDKSDGLAGMVRVVVVNSDWRPVEGIQHPFSTRVLHNGKIFVQFKVTAIRLNPDVSDVVFARPIN